MTRFKFGDNWQAYLQTVSEVDIQAATEALAQFLGMQSLAKLSFLDIGCGSGLHSLAASRLGAAKIVSLDYDPRCVDGTQKLRSRASDPAAWTVQQADILNETALTKNSFHIVYAWGSLHHTGDLWRAIEHSLQYVAPQGLFFVALYNKHWTSPAWRVIKRTYNVLPAWAQNGWVSLYSLWEMMKLNHRAARERGMKWRHDLRDWLGGYPYEYASRDEVVGYMKQRQFKLLKEVLNYGTGCSEYLFEKA